MNQNKIIQKLFLVCIKMISYTSELNIDIELFTEISQ